MTDRELAIDALKGLGLNNDQLDKVAGIMAAEFILVPRRKKDEDEYERDCQSCGYPVRLCIC